MGLLLLTNVYSWKGRCVVVIVAFNTNNLVYKLLPSKIVIEKQGLLTRLLITYQLL
ncbi:hypothetical protein MUGA111182_05985 [Mucilaginibacter galii]